MKGRNCLVTLSVAALLTISATAQQMPRKKVAVVLSGGGAKGMAHIGALKVIEKAGIPVDIVTGTSMGSIVGGLYAIGYNATCLDSMVHMQDWSFLLSDKTDPIHQSLADRKRQNTYFLSRDLSIANNTVKMAGGIVEGKNLARLFAKLTAGYRDSVDFNLLPVPFACVATDIVDNTEYVFHSGVLAEVMRASMSIPGAFLPVRKGDMVLVDGGLRNNFPVDVARQMGADVVIGVVVQGAPKTADELNSGSAILGQIVDVNCKNKYSENIANTDVLIHADTHGYSAASFSVAAIDTLIRRGEEAAMKHWDELVALKKQLGYELDFMPPKIALRHEKPFADKVKLHSISFVNVAPADEKLLKKKYRLAERDSISSAEMDQMVTSMHDDLFYSDADYVYNAYEKGYDVIVTAKEKRRNQVALGVRFDTEEMVALQVNSEFLLKTRMPMYTDVTLRLGKRIMFKADLNFCPWALGKMSVGYIFRHNDINVNEKGKRQANITYNQHTADLVPLEFNIRKFNIKLGLRWDYYHFSNILLDVGSGEWNADRGLDDAHYLTYRADVDYNSENKWNFPVRGAKFHAGYGYYTDNFIKYNHHAGIHAVNAMWRMCFPLFSRLTLQPMVYGRLVFGNNAPAPVKTVIGGEWFGHYLDCRHLPFAGVGYIERVEDKFMALQLTLQERLTENNYVLLKLAGYEDGKALKNLFGHGPKAGMQLSYYYDSMLGPLGATLGWSSKTKRLCFYINLGFEF